MEALSHSASLFQALESSQYIKRETHSLRLNLSVARSVQGQQWSLPS